MTNPPTAFATARFRAWSIARRTAPHPNPLPRVRGRGDRSPAARRIVPCNRLRLVGSILLLLTIAGCSSNPPDDGFAHVRDTTSARTGALVQWNRNSADDAAARAAVRRLIADELESAENSG